ncbi:regulatory protein RecX [Marinimicrobium alkaliphilum]|uniref:regulatory protein RecX n=1 Tax=Marinimicrobium alkaliphilum TaxID=2202654 RepID=UPI0018E0A730|nr:regulatory protein RecX [Marinimicrobium alkaliphilum]
MKDSQAASHADVRYTAMNLLARREHSAGELQQKLRQRFDDTTLIDDVLARLVEQDLLSDERFTEAFVRMRVGQGKGPLRIGQELKQKQVAEHLVDVYLGQADVDWFALARDVCERRFGDTAASDLKEKARRVRFLQYRGFTGEQVRAAIG